MKIGSINFYFLVYKSKINKKGFAPIYCRISKDKTTKWLSTSIFVIPTEFNSRDQRLSSENPMVQQLFNAWKNKLEKYLLKVFVEDLDISLGEVALYMKGKIGSNKSLGILEIFLKHNENIKELVGKDYSIRTWEKYQLILNQVHSFITEVYKAKDISIKKVSMKHLIEFEEYLLITRGLKRITVNKSIQRLKKIIRYAIGHEWLEKDPWMLHKSKSVQIEIRYLSKEEVDKLLVAKNLSPKLNRAKDCFLFQCFTGLGYAELKAFTKECLVLRENILWIKMRRQKTKNVVKVPVLPPAKKILDKYDSMLPVISNQKYNKYLKEVASELGIKTNLTIHLARKTFTTTVLLENNIPLKVASRLLAHTTTKTTEKHYAEISSGLLREHIKKLNKIYNKIY